MEPKLLTKKQVSEFLQISQSTVNNYMRKGIFKAYFIGRKLYFKLEDIEQCFQVIDHSKFKSSLPSKS